MGGRSPNRAAPTSLAPFLFAGALACSPAIDPLTVPIRGAGALLVVVVPEAGAPTVWAGDFADPVPAALGVPRPAAPSAALYALHYPCSLEALGLAAGPQVITDAAPSRPLPTEGVEALTARWTDAGGLEGAWSPAAPLPEVVTAIHLAGAPPTRCVGLDVQLIDLPGSSPGHLLVALDDRGTFLVATREGHFYRVSPAGAEPLPALPPSLPHAGAVREGERVRLVGLDGRLAVGTVEGGFEDVAPAVPLVPAGYRVWIEAAPDGSGLAVLSESGALFGLEGGAWVAWAPGLGHVLEDPFAGLAWTGPGELVAVGPRPTKLVRVRQGTVDEEDVQPPGGIRNLTGVGWIPGVGLLVGVDLGQIYRRDASGAWAALPESPFSRPTFTFAPFDDGFLAVGEKSLVAEYHADGGFCPGLVSTAGTHVVRMAVSGELYAALAESNGALQVALLRPSSPPRPRCGAP